MTASPLGLYPVVLTVIARTRIDAGKLVAVRRARCASEYGGVTRILVGCPETVTHEVSAEGFASVARTEGSAPMAPRRAADRVHSRQVELLEPHGRDESLDALLAARMGGTTSTTLTVTSFMTGLMGRWLARNG